MPRVHEPLPLLPPVGRCPFCWRRTRLFFDRRTGSLLSEACDPCSEGAGAGTALGAVRAQDPWWVE
jgi:hypothetical protein